MFFKSDYLLIQSAVFFKTT